MARHPSPPRRPLRPQRSDPPAAGVELIAATAIDDLGRIVGFGCFGGRLTRRDCIGGQVRAFLLTPPPGQMLQDLIELLGRFRRLSGGANSLHADLERTSRCIDFGDTGCLRGRLSALANEVEAQTGKALTEDEARLLATAVEGLRATQDDR